MMLFESAASLRPQPYGLPLRGRAPQTDGFKAKKNEWQVATQNRTPDKQAPSYFHRLVVQEWGKAHGGLLILLSIKLYNTMCDQTNALGKKRQKKRRPAEANLPRCVFSSSDRLCRLHQIFRFQGFGRILIERVS